MKHTPEELQAVWNANRGDMLICAGLEIRNRRHLAELRLEAVPVLARWALAIRRVHSNPFLLGKVCTDTSPNGFVASFDWLVKPDTLALIEEGTWDVREITPPTTTAPHDESYWELPRSCFVLPKSDRDRIRAAGSMALEMERKLKRRLTRNEQMGIIREALSGVEGVGREAGDREVTVDGQGSCG